MIELDELKDALKSPPGFEPVQLDLGYVMAAGGRRRCRRRVAAAAASGVVVVVLLGGGSELMKLGGPAGDRSSVSSDAAADPMPSNPMPSAINSSAPGILGRVVETGRRLGDQRWILYVETVDPDHLNANMTLVLGRTKTGYINDFTADIVSHDAGQARMSPGFHAVQAGASTAGRTTPAFGYYAGSPARITAFDTGKAKTINAHLTAWGGFGPKEKAQIFWFDFAQGQSPDHLTDLTAYDKNGNKLPGGSGSFTSR
jgi:hypothetical protein